MQTLKTDKTAITHGCYFDERAAERVKFFFGKFLQHSKGEYSNKPFELLEWQWEDIIKPIFGWKKKDGSRRFRTAYIFVPKKNGKSTLAAGIGLSLLIADNENGAEIYSCATKKEQASIVHNEAILMVRASKQLSEVLRVNQSTKTITNKRTNGFYKSLASDSRGTEGINASGLIMDETHAWDDKTFYDTLKYSGIARRQPLRFIITTAGIYDPSSVGWQEHEYAMNVANGNIDDWEYYSYLCGAKIDDDFTDPTIHKSVNPSYGSIIHPDEIMRAASEAQNRPLELFNFQRYRLNIWVNNVHTFFNMNKWKQCSAKIDRTELHGKIAFGGLDLASVSDFAAFGLLFPPQPGVEKWTYFCNCYAPEETAQRRQNEENVPYYSWGTNGQIILTPGNVIDYEIIQKDILEFCRIYNIEQIAADRWNLEAFRQNILKYIDVPIIPFAQTFYAESGAIKELDRLIASNNIIVDDNDALKWMAKNVVCIEDENKNYRLSKKMSKQKIDGITSLIMSLGRAIETNWDAEPVTAVFL